MALCSGHFLLFLSVVAGNNPWSRRGVRVGSLIIDGHTVKSLKI
jgi:hypothetical protein